MAARRLQIASRPVQMTARRFQMASRRMQIAARHSVIDYLTVTYVISADFEFQTVVFLRGQEKNAGNLPDAVVNCGQQEGARRLHLKKPEAQAMLKKPEASARTQQQHH